MTIAARVPSRESCSSDTGPGNFVNTAVASTGIRAGCPDAASWMTRTTLLPSTTTQIASSSDQLGRDSVRPSMAWEGVPRRPGRSTTTTPYPAHQAAASPPTPPPAQWATNWRPFAPADPRRNPAPAGPAAHPAKPMTRRAVRADPRPHRDRHRGRWPRRQRCSTPRRTCRRAPRRRR